MALKHKNRSFRKIFVKLADKVVLRYKKRKPKQAHCGRCSRLLQGVPRDRPYKMQNRAKTTKRPDRPYGGVLCSRCLRQEMVSRARSL